MQEGIHDEFVRRLDERLQAAPIGDLTRDVLYGPMIHERFADRFEEWLGLIRDHHTPHGSSAQGRIGPAALLAVGDPEAGLFYHPTFVTGVRAGDELYSTETCLALLVGVARFADFDEAMELANLQYGYGLSSAIYTTSPLHAFRFRERISAGMVSINNFHLGRRGAPAVRRQRQVGQRPAPVRHLGARPVHALAVGQLGLRRQAAEGADGRGDDRGQEDFLAGGTGVLDVHVALPDPGHRGPERGARVLSRPARRDGQLRVPRPGRRAGLRGPRARHLHLGIGRDPSLAAGPSLRFQLVGLRRGLRRRDRPAARGRREGGPPTSPPTSRGAKRGARVLDPDGNVVNVGQRA